MELDGEMLHLILMIIIAVLISIVIKTTDIIGSFFIKSIIAIRNLKLHVNAIYKDLNTINREIDVEYSPAVTSYIYNTKLEPKKDILATILNLYNKRVMTIEKNETGYKFVPNYKADLTKLSSDEKYIYCFFIEGSENIKLFSTKDWEELVKKECDKYGHYKINKYKIDDKISYRPLIIDVIIVLLFRKNIISLIFKQASTGMVFVDWGIPILFGIFNWIVLMLIDIICYDKILYIKHLLNGLTESGKNEIKKWMKFKKFIKDYTLIEERKIEEVVIYEKYIPYAMALGINKEYNDEKIKDFVDNYMRVIDKSVEKYLYTNLFEKNDD